MTRGVPPPLLVLLLLDSVLGRDPGCGPDGPALFCVCKFRRADRRKTQSCYVQGPLTPDDNVWERFGSMDDVAELDFVCRKGSELKFVPSKAVSSLLGLEVVRIQQASLGVVPTGAWADVGLTELDMADNEVTSLEPASFVRMKSLKTLSLSKNLLRELPEGVWVDLPALEGLFLEGNEIGVVRDRAFRGLASLKDLDLSSNSLRLLEEQTFYGLSELVDLDLYRNQIGGVDADAFRWLKKLRRLDLNKNLISRLHPLAFRGLDSLEHLILNHNLLKTLPEGIFSRSPCLRNVGLAFNKLEDLPTQVLPDSDSDYFFRFTGNPFVCQCGLWVAVQRHLNGSGSDMWKNELLHLRCRKEDIGETEVHLLSLEESGCPEDVCISNCSPATFEAQPAAVENLPPLSTLAVEDPLFPARAEPPNRNFGFRPSARVALLIFCLLAPVG